MRKSLKNRVLLKIKRARRRNVFMRSDFEELSKDYDQIGRAIRQLVRDGKLVRIGYGLYAKARLNPLTSSPRLAASGGFNQVSKEALNRLNVKWDDSLAKRGNQIPANTVVTINGRFNREISYKKNKLLVKKS